MPRREPSGRSHRDMKRAASLTHEFVEFVPDTLETGKIYVSISYATVVHKCCCGCGHEVVTPISPTAWKLIFDGRTISLDPSIGNWNFPCRSHYWIRGNEVKWAEPWSVRQVEAARNAERHENQRFFDRGKTQDEPVVATPSMPEKQPWWRSWWPW
jgi:hypothetical protein